MILTLRFSGESSRNLEPKLDVINWWGHSPPPFLKSIKIWKNRKNRSQERAKRGSMAREHRRWCRLDLMPIWWPTWVRGLTRGDWLMNCCGRLCKGDLARSGRHRGRCQTRQLRQHEWWQGQPDGVGFFDGGRGMGGAAPIENTAKPWFTATAA